MMKYLSQPMPRVSASTTSQQRVTVSQFSADKWCNRSQAVEWIKAHINQSASPPITLISRLALLPLATLGKVRRSGSSYAGWTDLASEGIVSPSAASE